MRYLLLLMVAPQLAFAGTSAAHSNDFKALEVLEASSPPAPAPAPKPVQKAKPKPAPAPKPAPPEPSADAKALDALMASTPDSVPPAPKAAPKPVAVAEPPVQAPKKTVTVPRPLHVVAKAKAKAKVKVAKAAPLPKSRYVNAQRAIAKAAPAKAPQKFAMSSSSKTNSVPASIEFKKQQDTDEIVTPSADAEALDALIDSTPTQPARAVVPRPVVEQEEEQASAVEVREAPQARPARSKTRYLNDNQYRREIDPNEIQKVPPKAIQSVWY